jgi:hypothetical protein
MAWFGPKGVATMAFALFVLGEGIPAGERIFDIAALPCSPRSCCTG